MARGHDSRHNCSMHWVTVSDLRMPICIGGDPALDFCNTGAGWGGPVSARQEWLRSYDHLAVWAWHAGLIEEQDAERLRRTAKRSRTTATAVLTDARRLRTVLRRAVLDPQDARALGMVTGYVRRAWTRASLQPGSPSPQWVIPESTGLAWPLLEVARAAGDLLTSEDIERVKICDCPQCGWLFIDRTGRRRWCSMSTCGNRAKVMAYARRHRR